MDCVSGSNIKIEKMKKNSVYDQKFTKTNLGITYFSRMAYASGGKPIAPVPEVVLIALSMGMHTIAPVQSLLPER